MSHTNSKKIKYCRACDSARLTALIDLGNHAISGFFPKPNTPVTHPLALVLCDQCKLVQLAHLSVPADDLYRQYWYKSGINRSMKQALQDIVKSIKKRITIFPEDIIVDIGANDGTLLGFWGKPVTTIGFEPAKNLVAEAKTRATNIINDFFSWKSLNSITHGKKAKVITTIAMFYDLENPNSFVSDLSTSLTQYGVWVNQMASLSATVKNNMFDNICHEHIEHYSLYSLESLLARHNLSVVDIETNDVNGGSMRVYIMHTETAGTYKYPDAKKRLSAYRHMESNLKLTNLSTYRAFNKRVLRIKKHILSFIATENKRGKIVYGYGASTKGNTLLQYYKIAKNQLPYIAERNPSKWGLYTAGTNIPIISEAQARRDKPDIFIVLPWHFKKEFITREITYLKNGGTLLFPLPVPVLVTVRRGKINHMQLTMAK